MDPSLIGFGLSIVVCMLIFVFSDIDSKKQRHERLIEARDSYELYETASMIEEIWNDDNDVQECHYCGRDDAAVFLDLKDEWKCKWCAEYDNLTYHLNHHGVRRLLKLGTK